MPQILSTEPVDPKSIPRKGGRGRNPLYEAVRNAFKALVVGEAVRMTVEYDEHMATVTGDKSPLPRGQKGLRQALSDLTRGTEVRAQTVFGELADQGDGTWTQDLFLEKVNAPEAPAPAAAPTDSTESEEDEADSE